MSGQQTSRVLDADGWHILHTGTENTRTFSGRHLTLLLTPQCPEAGIAQATQLQSLHYHFHSPYYVFKNEMLLELPCPCISASS